MAYIQMFPVFKWSVSRSPLQWSIQFQLYVLGKWSCKSPETAESAALQEMKLLLRFVVFTRDHVLDDGLHGSQNCLVVAQRKHVRDFCVLKQVNKCKMISYVFKKNRQDFCYLLLFDGNQKQIQWGSEYQLVKYSNGKKEIKCQMVLYSNAIRIPYTRTPCYIV